MQWGGPVAHCENLGVFSVQALALAPPARPALRINEPPVPTMAIAVLHSEGPKFDSFPTPTQQLSKDPQVVNDVKDLRRRVRVDHDLLDEPLTLLKDTEL